MPVLQHNKEKVLSCLLVRRGRTSTTVQEASGLSGFTVNHALRELKAEGRVVELTGKKKNRRWRKVTPAKPRDVKRAPPIRPDRSNGAQLELPVHDQDSDRVKNALAVMRKVESLPEADREFTVRFLAGLYLGHGQD